MDCKMSATTIVLAGDVGGTNTRLQLTEHFSNPHDSKSSHNFTPAHHGDSPRSMSEISSHYKYQSNYRSTVKVLATKRYKAANYTGLEQIVEIFLKEVNANPDGVADCSSSSCVAAAASGSSGASSCTTASTSTGAPPTSHINLVDFSESDINLAHKNWRNTPSSVASPARGGMMSSTTGENKNSDAEPADDPSKVSSTASKPFHPESRSTTSSSQVVIVPDATPPMNQPRQLFDGRNYDANGNPRKLRVEACCIAVAGPVINGEVEFTNLPWGVREEDLAKCLRIDVSRVKLINDFVANGYGIETLEIRAEKTSASPPTLERVLSQHPDVLCLQEPLEEIDDQALLASPIATIGAGTGLGYGIVTRDARNGHTTSVYPSEGGHMDFAPVDDEQLGLFQFLRKKLHRVSAERVCCGPGILNIYKYVRENPLYNTPENPQLKRELCKVREIDQPALIFEYAQKKDPMCLRTLDIFIKVYGAVAGNWALATLPKQGLFILGGIGPKMAKELSDGRFIDKFRDKGRMTGLVRDIPVYLVLNGDVGLQGASVVASRLVPGPGSGSTSLSSEQGSS